VIGMGVARPLSRISCPSSTPARPLGDPTIADAVLDRLVRNSHRLILKGESLRKAAYRFQGIAFVNAAIHSNRVCLSNR
jgi:hypothetical protein